MNIKTNSVAAQFLNFVEQSIDSDALHIKTRGEMLVVDIFLVKPQNQAKHIELPGAISMAELGHMWYPIARVLCENEAGIPVNTFVRLWDAKVNVFINPKYEEWQSLSSRGNVEKLGVQPPKLICRFYDKFQPYTFRLNPLKSGEDKHNAFCIPQFEIAATINDPYAIANI